METVKISRGIETIEKMFVQTLYEIQRDIMWYK